jgi:threonine synthase
MYFSTRGTPKSVTSAEAIIAGMAPDGGLFVPETIPKIALTELQSLLDKSYQQRAFYVMGLLLTDYSAAELQQCINNAYSAQKFDHQGVAPLVAINESTAVLELWHGPTSAFKDMALQLLPQLLTTALKKRGQQDEIVILVATSGDTGKAALEGFQDVKQTRIITFYPESGVSAIQKLQMVTQSGANVSVIAVTGNFDAAQSGVKEIFQAEAFNAQLRRSSLRLSSANSINWGRLAPQIVYYFSAYLDGVKTGRLSWGQQVNFSVPTGNFGDILAGYYAKQMGLPIGKLLCASNANNVLTDFIKQGCYDARRPFYQTSSPSMDILISSNLERLLYHLTQGDTAKVKGWMDELKATGHYQVSADVMDKIKQLFYAGWIGDEQTVDTIKQVYEQQHYVLDPHTAVAWQIAANYRSESGDDRPCIVLSTASPFKFSDTVLGALTAKSVAGQSEFDLLKELADITGWKIPAGLAALKNMPIRHKQSCAPEDMKQLVAQVLGQTK